MLLHTDPIGSSNLNDQLNGVFHEKPSISSHHQRGSLALGRLDDGDNALNEVLGIVLVLLEHRHPLPQPARPGLLVRVRLCLDLRYFHHGWHALSTFSRPVWSAERPDEYATAAAEVGGHPRWHQPATPPSNPRPPPLKGRGETVLLLKKWIITLITSQYDKLIDPVTLANIVKCWNYYTPAACHHQTF